MELAQWHSQTETNIDILTTLDRLVTSLRDLDNQLDISRKQQKTLNEDYRAVENELIHTLKAVNKDEFSVRNVGRIKIGSRTSVKTPKDEESKTLLMNYITEKYGDEVAFTYLTVNSATLNSFFKSELESSEDPAGFELPGIGAPVVSEFIRFLK